MGIDKAVSGSMAICLAWDVTKGNSAWARKVGALWGLPKINTCLSSVLTHSQTAFPL